MVNGKKSSNSDLRVEIQSNTLAFAWQGRKFDLENFLKSAIRFQLNCLSRHLVISKRRMKSLKEAEDNGWWWVQKWWHLKEIHIYALRTHFTAQKNERVVWRKVMKAWKFPPLHFQQVNTIRACMSGSGCCDFMIKFFRSHHCRAV